MTARAEDDKREDARQSRRVVAEAGSGRPMTSPRWRILAGPRHPDEGLDLRARLPSLPPAFRRRASGSSTIRAVVPRRANDDDDGARARGVCEGVGAGTATSWTREMRRGRGRASSSTLARRHLRHTCHKQPRARCLARRPPSATSVSLENGARHTGREDRRHAGLGIESRADAAAIEGSNGGGGTTIDARRVRDAKEGTLI